MRKGLDMAISSNLWQLHSQFINLAVILPILNFFLYVNNLKPSFSTVINSNQNVCFILNPSGSSTFLNKVQDVILVMKVIFLDGREMR